MVIRWRPDHGRPGTRALPSWLRDALAARAIAAAGALADGETRPDQPDRQVVEALKALATAQTTLTETQRALFNAALDAGVSVRRKAAAAGRPVVTVQKWWKDAKESD